MNKGQTVTVLGHHVTSFDFGYQMKNHNQISVFGRDQRKKRPEAEKLVRRLLKEFR